MTREPSTPVDSRAPSVSRTSPDGDWDRQLADAFAVLLGRPLREYDPDAVYVACVDGNLLNETGFRQDAAWVRPAALSGAEPVVWDYVLFDETERTPVFDVSGSFFDFWAPDGGSGSPSSLKSPSCRENRRRGC
ncbi:hypothetical protein [Streptosporangium sp. NPDC001681]|uniref:hypothetical protein n=1 Tax=Streptosporangium sp. NPDC001681 TaxID=3154395 RepID=UPI003323A018